MNSSIEIIMVWILFMFRVIRIIKILIWIKLRKKREKKEKKETYIKIKKMMLNSSIRSITPNLLLN